MTEHNDHQHNAELVASPTDNWLKTSLMTCSSRLIVASPFVSRFFLNLLETVTQPSQRILITRTDLREFVTGASSIETLHAAASMGVDVRSLPGLHAKVYVIDDQRALITSANATSRGMLKNLEFGAAFDDHDMVAMIAETALSGFGAENPPSDMTAEELGQLLELSKKIRPLIPKMPDVGALAQEETEHIRLEVQELSDIVESFTGWTRLTLEGLVALPKEAFQLNDVYKACAANARKRYPNNKHQEAKLRQQLQRLRDIGLVDFLGHGRYRKTFGKTGETLA